jgi:hypothetical protein
MECQMRFRLVTLVLTTTIFALLVGWTVDRHRYTASLQKELTEHISGNVNIQNAWTRSELASDYFANPGKFESVIEEQLLHDVFWLWKYREFVDTAFNRRSPGNTAISLAQHTLSPLKYSSAQEYFENARRVGMLGSEQCTFPELSDIKSPKYLEFQAFVDAVFQNTETVVKWQEQ